MRGRLLAKLVWRYLLQGHDAGVYAVEGCVMAGVTLALLAMPGVNRTIAYLTPQARPGRPRALVLERCAHSMVVTSWTILISNQQLHPAHHINHRPALVICQLHLPPTGDKAHDRLVLLARQLHARPCSDA
jgi:hypothetical protein